MRVLKVAILAVCCGLAFTAKSPQQSAYLDGNEKFLLEWAFDHDEIILTVTANTTGWLGLGFSPNGGMAGADIVTAWVKDGKTIIQVYIFYHCDSIRCNSFAECSGQPETGGWVWLPVWYMYIT